MSELSELNIVRINFTATAHTGPIGLEAELAVGASAGLDADEEPITMVVEDGDTICPVVFGLAVSRHGEIGTRGLYDRYAPYFGDLRFKDVGDAIKVPDLKDTTKTTPGQLLNDELWGNNRLQNRFSLIGTEAVQEVLSTLINLPEERKWDYGQTYYGGKRYILRALARAVAKRYK